MNWLIQLTMLHPYFMKNILSLTFFILFIANLSAQKELSFNEIEFQTQDGITILCRLPIS